MAPTIDQLTQAHPSYNQGVAHWDLLTRLVDGGQAVTLEDKKRMLRHPDNRPENLKNKRAEVAHYSPLLGGLVVKLQAQIMRSPGIFEPFRVGTTTLTDDEVWGEFLDEATHDGKSFREILSRGVLLSLTTGQCFFQIDTLPTPQARTRAEQRAMGGDRPFIVLRPRSAVLDWDSDYRGYKFAKIYTTEVLRDGWTSTPTHAHRYQIYQRLPDNRITSQEWRVIPKDPNATALTPPDSESLIEVISEEQEIFNVASPTGAVYRFPLVSMQFPPALVVGTQLYELLTQHFTQIAAINYASLISLWRQLIFTGVNDPSVVSRAIGDGAGDGYWWGLPLGVDARWLETDTAGLDFALRYSDRLEKTMYDQISQIAASAAATFGAISQSGESKKQDRRNMDILLGVYGNAVRGAAKQVLDCAAIARGELLDWGVQGFNKYDSDGLLEDLQEFTAATEVVQSPTFDREGRKAIAAAGVEALGLPPELTNAIFQEIDEVA